MKLSVKRFALILLVSLFAVGCAALSKKEAPAANDSGLVNSLVQKLGISKEQATGGAGAVLGYAKSKLSPADFSSVSKAMPETDSLISAAPQNDSLTSKLGSMAGNAGADGGAGGMGALASSFGALGLSPDMIGKFLPVVLDYAKSAGGGTVASLLQGVLK